MFRPELGMSYGRYTPKNLTATQVMEQMRAWPEPDLSALLQREHELIRGAFMMPSFVARETDYSALVKPNLEDTMSDQTTQPNLAIRTLNRERSVLLSRITDYEVNFKSYIEARDSYEKHIAETAGNLEKTRAELADVEKALVAIGAEKVVTKTVSFT